MKRVYRFKQGDEFLDQEQYRSWMEANGYGANLAAKKDVAERAAEAVQNALRASDKAKDQIQAQWVVVDRMMRGEALSSAVPLGTEDVHIPETKKAIEVMVPRIVDAISGMGGDVFQVKGRDDADRTRALVIEEWIRYQLSKSRWYDEAEDRVRSALLYGMIAVYTGWETRFSRRLVKKSYREVDETGQGEILVIEQEEKDIEVYSGFVHRAVDPRDFIFDASRMCMKDARFAGERMKLSIPELLQMEAQGVLSGVAEAIEGKSGRAGVLQDAVEKMRSDSEKAERAGVTVTDLWRRMQSEIKPIAHDLVDCVSLWSEWSDKEHPTSAMDWGQWQFFYVNGVPCRIAKNPYDSQHLPYAVARIAREPFVFWALSPALDAAKLNADLDQHSALGARSHALAVSPFVVADESVDFPSENLNNIQVGEIIRGNLDKMRVEKFPSTIGDTMQMVELRRRDIREIMGAPEGFTGTSTDGTATQYNGNIDEANRRIRGMVIRLANDCDKMVAEHCLLYSQQFVRDVETYRVLGRGAKQLGFSANLRPEDLIDPVDIEMIGPATFGSHGQRATKLISLMNQAQFLIAAEAQKGNIDTSQWLDEIYTGVMGHRMRDGLLKKNQDPETVLPVSFENALLRKEGMQLDVHPLDDDMEHFQSHRDAADAAESAKASPDVLAQFAAHMQLHMDQYQRKQAVQQAQQRAQALAQQANPAAQSTAFPGTEKAPQDGRTYQRPPDLIGSGYQTPPGETPGPGNPSQVAAPDRSQAIVQTANR